ncbi:MAG: peptide ABC transporter substrate-binding protein [Anaerolineales bacterium]|nr:peptide ABC transporter substrate-binding protein [Anaerolineales bacterium]
MRKNPLLFLFLLLVVASLVLVACGSQDEASDEPAVEQPSGDEPAVEEPAERKVATFIWTQEIDSLNPMYTNMWFSAITQQIWNCDAWDYDELNNPHPVLITEMPSVANGGISADGRTFTFKLRDDIVWSDGEPITSADFLFVYEMYTSPTNTVASTYPYDLVASIEAPDERTVVMTFAEPFVPWATTLFQEMLPKHILQPVFDAEGSLDEADWNQAPTVGCGPFVFTEWESGSYARFVRNENYYNEPAKIDEIFMRFVPDDAAQIAALRTGEGDLGTFISYSDMPTLEEAGVEIIMVPSGYNEGWYFYFGEEAHPAITDVRVRQAIAMCFDRFSVNEDLLLGKTEPAVTFWDKMPYANPELEPYPYDPAAANALLDEAGWIDSNGDGVRDKDGVELILTHGTTTREIRVDTQAVAQQNLAECGVQLDLIGYSSDIFFGSYGEGGPMPTGELDIAEWSANPAFPDPDSARWLCEEVPSDEFPDGNNDQHLCDEKLDALFQLQKTQVDFAARQATFWEISEYMFEQVYWLGVWQDPDSFAISGRLENVRISGVTPFFNINEWDIVP